MRRARRLARRLLYSETMLTHRFAGALVLGLSLAAPVFTWSTDAQACSAPLPSCSPPVRLFGDDVSVSGNLIYFKVLGSEPTDLVLRTKGGDTIPARVRTIGKDRVFSPDETVASDVTLELEYTTVCPSSETLTPTRETYEFRSWEARDIHLRPPELQVFERGVSYPGLPNNEATFVRLRYYSPDADATALHLMDHYVQVDGQAHRYHDDDGMPLVELSASCDPESTENLLDTCGSVWRFATGVHHVVAWSTVVGQSEEPEEAAMDVELKCSGTACPEPPESSDAGPDESDPGDAKAKNGSDGGCAISGPHQPSTGGSWLGVLAGALLALARKRAKSAGSVR